MKKLVNAMKNVSKFAAKQSVNSASLWYFHQEKESKEVREALLKKEK